MKPHVSVPPTRYYLSRRAELFRIEALRCRDTGDLVKCAELLARATEYSKRAGELPLDTQEGQDETPIHNA